MKHVLKLCAVIAALMLVFGFASCKNDDDDDEPTYYTVTIASGIVTGTVTANKTSAEAGDTIKLTATPADGYTLDTFSVTDANGNAITVTGGTFTMPASNVTVSAIFKSTTYRVTIASTIEHGTVTANKTSAAAGDTVKLTAMPADGYALDSFSVTDANGNAITVTESTFTMPASNVIVSATFKQTTSGGDEETHQYTVSIASGIANGTVSASATTAAENATVALTITPSTGYALDTLTVKDAGGNIVTVTSDNTFVMPASAVTVTATFTALPPDTANYTVRHLFQKVDASGYEQNTTDYPNETKSGTIGAQTEATAKTVTGFTAQAVTQATIVASDTAVEIKYDRNTHTVTYEDGVEGETIAVPADSTAYRYGETVTLSFAEIGKRTGYTFMGWGDGSATYTNGGTNTLTMGDRDVTLTAQWELTAYRVTIADGITNGSVSASATTATMGTTVTLTVTPSNNFALATLTVKDASDNAVTVTNNTFTMPASTVTVSATFSAMNASYTVRHLFQKVDASGYEQNASYPDETKSGTIGAQTQAEAKTVTGFTAQSITQAAIAASGTAVEIKYDRKTYTVTFNANGGSTVSAQTVRYEASATAPTAPTKTNYTFAGWYTSADGGSAFDFGTKITANTMLYAKWAEVAVTGVSLSKTSLELTAGGSAATLTATVSPSNATNKTVTWTSSDTSKATIDSAGKVTPVAAGSATITATAGGKSATCTVTVKAATYSVTVSGASNGSVSASATSATAGTQITLTVSPNSGYALDTLTVKDASGNAVTVSSNKFTMPASAVTVTAAFKLLTYTVTFNTSGGSTVASQTVSHGSTATKPADPTKSGYRFDGWYTAANGNTTFNFGTKITANTTVYAHWTALYTVTLTGGANATTSGGNATQEGLSGAMTAVTYTANTGYHFAAFTAITSNGITATRTSDTVVTVSGTPTANASITIPDAVEIAVTGVSLNKTTLVLTAGGDTATLTATVTPNNAKDKTVTWTSSNTSVASVTNGTVTPVAAGSATITATAGGKSATCTVTVKAATIAVTGITLNKTSAAIVAGDTETLTATVSPDNATDKTVTWSSNDTSVATVENGVVTPVAAGSATITATAGGKSVTCTVTVTLPQYADQLREATDYSRDFASAGFVTVDYNTGMVSELIGKEISADEALALAKYKKQQTNSNCAVLYALSGAWYDRYFQYVTGSGEQGSARADSYISNTALNGYKLYVVSE